MKQITKPKTSETSSGASFGGAGLTEAMVINFASRQNIELARGRGTSCG
jgi:hypothetical protein